MGLWDNPPYYLTAYGIAVKHGFRGTEVDWLATLKYPVGAVYLSVSKTPSPAILFGGTWVEIEDAVLLTAGETFEAGESYQADVTACEAENKNCRVVYAWIRTK